MTASRRCSPSCTYALKSLEELKAGLSSAGQAAVMARREAEQARKAALHDGSTERVTEVFQQILGLAAQRNAQTRRPQPAAPTLSAPRVEPVKREERHGFDDAHAPMAILALNGKFKELNPAFTKLVGYKEHEFMKAAWPSPHDRKDYKDQLEQLRRLGVGELQRGRGHEHVHARPGSDGPGCRNADARHGRRRRPVTPRARGRRPRHGVTPSAGGASIAHWSLPLRRAGNPPGARVTTPFVRCSASARKPVAQRTALAPRLNAPPAARVAPAA